MRKLTLLLIVFLLGACAREPWVRPYEREALADSMMSFNQDPIADSSRTHVFDVREGAHGAGQSQGGGCGCN
ncbi:MAG: DUF4266 domain-containing protein [Gammaproteobacteria bacterium]|jgi:hypothetical protein|nr:DUF4266 domain-containing protein [Gammaproteobacteria bacterium]